jgi:predicted acyl esterase
MELQGIVAAPHGPRDSLVDEIRVRMRDGVRLASDLYLPNPLVRAARNRLPVVLARLPYGKRGATAFMPQIAERVTERGYAMLVQDVRGKGQSGGRFDPFVQEFGDGWDTLQWIADQPWCDGRIGMLGDSYYGYTQWAAAASGHPALACIAPRVTSTRVADDWMFNGGVFCLATMLDWAAQTWAGPGLNTYPRDWSVRPLDGIVEHWLDGRHSDVLDEWRTRSPTSPAWQQFPLNLVRAGSVDIPTLHIGGWWDVFRRGQLRDWAATAGLSQQRLIMTATDHIGLDLTWGGRPTPNFLSNDDAMQGFLPGYLDPVLDFMDVHLRGADASGVPAVRIQVAGGGWRNEACWPPADPCIWQLWLTDGDRASIGPHGGTLSGTADRSPAALLLHHDPADLVPTLDSDIWAPLAQLPDESRVESRPDVLTFTSEALVTSVELLGPLVAQIEMAAPQGPGQVVLKVVDVFPDGFGQRITEGVQALDASAEPRGVTVDLASTAYLLQAGHRIRLEVAASQFPRFLPVLSRTQDPWSAAPEPPWDLRVFIGGSHRSALSLSCSSMPTVR